MSLPTRRQFIMTAAKALSALGFVRLAGLSPQSLWARTRKNSRRRAAAEELFIRVLIYEGSSLPQSFPIKTSAKGLHYQGKLFPPTNSRHGKTAIVDIAPNAPIVYKGNAYAGKMLVVRQQQKLLVVNELSFDHYLMGVVKKEISASWPLNAIKAQAVAARSYAYNYLQLEPAALFHLSSSTNHQVFGGTAELPQSIVDGVQATNSMILLDKIGRKPVQSFFHACCGGVTEKAEQVWKSNVRLSYFKNIRCPYCTTHPLYQWERRFNVTQLHTALERPPISNVKALRVKRLSGSKRIAEIQVKTQNGTHTISGNEFRIAVSAKKIPSTRFKLRRSGRHYLLTGRGFGHGVGLCQWGAKTMAEKGYAHTAILNFYYKNCSPISIAKYKRRYA